MGNIQTRKPTPSGLIDLHILVRRETAVRVAEAAKRVDQPVSAWVRMAIIEKLNRDA